MLNEYGEMIRWTWRQDRIQPATPWPLPWSYPISQVSLFGFGIDQIKRWSHYWDDKYWFKSSMYSFEEEQQVILKLQCEGKLLSMVDMVPSLFSPLEAPGGWQVVKGTLGCQRDWSGPWMEITLLLNKTLAYFSHCIPGGTKGLHSIPANVSPCDSYIYFIRKQN